MTDIDSIRIVFQDSDKTIMNICIAFLMFGVALDMRISDFRRVLRYPRSVAVGLTSQLIILPLLTIGLIKIWGPAPSMALGLILIAACPGGNVSNYAVHLGRGNAALSVTMTSIVTLSAFIITPISFALWSRLVPETQPILAQVSISALDLLKIIIQLIVIPLAIGMFVNKKLPRFSSYIKRPVRILSMVIFMTFIAFALAKNWANILQYLQLVFILVVLHNVIALAGGYWFARLNKRPQVDCKAIAMETGIQNAGLGLALIIDFFGDFGGMMIVAAFWGVWNMIAAFSLGMYWRLTSEREQQVIPIS